MVDRALEPKIPSTPLQHTGLARRATPFAAAILAASALIHLEPTPDRALEIVAFAGLVAVILIATMVLPWERLADQLQVVPPVAFLGAVALLRDGTGEATSPYTPLVILPVLWLGLYGSGQQLAAGLGAVALALVAPIVWFGYGAGEWRSAAIWLAVSILIGATVHRLAHELRDGASRLEAVSRIDYVTGLLNRRAWDSDLPRELARAARDGRPLCAAMLDLDGFKAFNDEEGHQAGDRLLKECAAGWSTMLRTTDLLARFGGDEFAVLLTGCALSDAVALVSRLRDGMPTGQTLSAGVAGWDCAESADSLVARADEALYEAKRSGRDRVLASA